MSRAAYGNGAVYLRGKRWWITFSHRGTCYRESSKTGSRAEAVRLLRQRLAELGQGRAPIVQDRATFAVLAKLIEQDYTINGRRSWDRVDRALVHLRRVFGEHLAADITPAAVTAYKAARLAAGAAPATVQYEVAALRRMFTLGFEQQVIAHRPAIRGLKVENARQGFFTAEQVTALLEALPEAVRPVVAFGFYTGWRIRSEVLPLRWAQVDLAAGEVRLEVGTTKNGEGRAYPFARLPALEELLERQRAATDALEAKRGVEVPWVFHRNGRRIRDFRGAWEKACEAVGVVGLIPHDLRRSAVRNLVNAGAPQDAAMKLTGHKTREVFRRYNIVTRGETDDAVARLAGFLDEQANSRTIAARQKPAATGEELNKSR